MAAGRPAAKQRGHDRPRLPHRVQCRRLELSRALGVVFQGPLVALVNYLGRPLIAWPGSDPDSSGPFVWGCFPWAWSLSTGAVLLLGAPLVPVRGQTGWTKEGLPMLGRLSEVLGWVTTAHV